MAEISKRDIWSPARVAQDRPDVDYKLVAIDFLPVQVILSLADPCTLSFSGPVWYGHARVELLNLEAPMSITMVPETPKKEKWQVARAIATPGVEASCS